MEIPQQPNNQVGTLILIHLCALCVFALKLFSKFVNSELISG